MDCGACTIVRPNFPNRLSDGTNCNVDVIATLGALCEKILFVEAVPSLVLATLSIQRGDLSTSRDARGIRMNPSKDGTYRCTLMTSSTPRRAPCGKGNRFYPIIVLWPGN